jgi:hypothetical protein
MLGQAFLDRYVKQADQGNKESRTYTKTRINELTSLPDSEVLMN